jgi:hypothetical protein
MRMKGDLQWWTWHNVVGLIGSRMDICEAMDGDSRGCVLTSPYSLHLAYGHDGIRIRAGLLCKTVTWGIAVRQQPTQNLSLTVQ